jgi:glycosyltransferase involved in cell wall biosynthesis
MKNKPSITVFFPCYNDAGTIASMVVMAFHVLRRLSDDYEVIVVNDGSSDHSQEILEELKTKYPQLKIIRHEDNKGYGGALKSGFAHASKDFVFYTDGDAQYSVKEMESLLSAMDGDVDLVNGYKISRSDPLHRVIIGRMYHWVVKIAFGLKLKDVDCDFRLMRRSIFDKVKLESNTGVICVELVRKIQSAGFRIKQVPVHHYHRAYGKSQFFNCKRIFKALFSLCALWWKLIIVKET